MSNYCCASRTNFFRVKDVDAFTAWAKRLALDVCEGNCADRRGMFAVFPGDATDSGEFPTSFEDDDEFDFVGELGKHLAEGSVAVVISAGAEKLRYVHGYAVAVNSAGRRVSIALDSIYGRAARRLGGQVTRAEY